VKKNPVSKTMQKEFLAEQIFARCHFLLDQLFTHSNHSICPTNLDCLQILERQKNGLYWTWVCITGCYPGKSEFLKYTSKVQIDGFAAAAMSLIYERRSSSVLKKFMDEIVLIEVDTPHLADVTHTDLLPYVTGIQRVVREIVGATNKTYLTSFRQIDTYGILNPCSLEIRKDARKPEQVRKPPSIDLIQRLENLVPRLGRTNLGTAFYILALPFARRLKRLIKKDATSNYIEAHDGLPLTNLFIGKSMMTILEFPHEQSYIEFYELLMEQEIVEVQIISYDFIPIFHSWTVHAGNRGHFTQYLRLILLANRVVAIGQLIEDQVNLITKAFHLERKEWAARKRIVSSLPLPAGITKDPLVSFKKDPRLFVMLGSLEPRKNHVQFLDALEILFRRKVYVKARLVGSTGWNNEYILERISRMQRDGIDLLRVSATDDELHRYIGEANALLQISEAEGFGLPVAEARELGTTVIVSDIRPLNNMYGEMPYIVEIGNGIQLADVMQNLVENPVTVEYLEAHEVTWKDWSEKLFS
jgi:glycosyltransferase involved in cell wall biosynthesis